MGNTSSCIIQGFTGFTACWCKVHETWKDTAMEQPVGILDEEKCVLEKSYYTESCGGGMLAAECCSSADQRSNLHAFRH